VYLFTSEFGSANLFENGCNYNALIFADTVIHGMAGFYGLAWVLRVYFPGKRRIFCS